MDILPLLSLYRGEIFGMIEAHFRHGVAIEEFRGEHAQEIVMRRSAVERPAENAVIDETTNEPDLLAPLTHQIRGDFTLADITE